MSGAGRIFASVNLSPTLQDAAARLQKGLLDGRQGVIPVRPRDMHLTLRYFGQIDDETISRVTDACAAAGSCRRFRITLGGLGFFPDLRRPRVLWTGITEGDEGIRSLYGNLEVCLVQAGMEREKRLFMPHLTLARLDRGAPDITASLGVVRDACLGSQDVDRLYLMESRPGRRDPRYVCLASWPLSGA